MLQRRDSRVLPGSSDSTHRAPFRAIRVPSSPSSTAAATLKDELPLRRCRWPPPRWCAASALLPPPPPLPPFHGCSAAALAFHKAMALGGGDAIAAGLLASVRHAAQLLAVAMLSGPVPESL